MKTLTPREGLAFCHRMSDHVNFQIDTALLQVFGAPVDSSLWMQTVECWKCDLQKACKLPDHPIKIMVDTRYATRIAVQKGPNDTLCEREFHFDERGVYNLSLFDGTCTIQEESPPIGTYTPLIIAASILLTCMVLFPILYPLGMRMVKYIYHRWQAARSIGAQPDLSDLVDEETIEHASNEQRGDHIHTGQVSGERPVPAEMGQKRRLRCLDVFRGMSIILMIFVNYGGGQYFFFAHSPWNGLTLADLVFPWFMFISGASVALSVDSFLKRNTEGGWNKWGYYYLKVIRRAVLLFAFGLFMVNALDGSSWTSVRIMGVLQRFAIAGFILSTLRILAVRVPFSVLRERKDDLLYAGGLWNFAKGLSLDISAFWIEWAFMSAMTAVWLGLTFLLPVEGCPTGYLGPGGLSEHSAHVKCTGGAARIIDQAIVGERHIFRYPTTIDIYHTHVPYDPEGVLGSLMSTLAAFLGLQAGNIFLLYERPLCRLVRLCSWSVLCGILAGMLCGFSQNDGWMPVNKNLWSVPCGLKEKSCFALGNTSPQITVSYKSVLFSKTRHSRSLSFVLATAATGFAIIAVLFLIQDHKHWWDGAPFYFAGMNPLLLYVGHEVMSGRLPVSWSVSSTHTAQLWLNIWGVAFWIILAFYWKLIGFYWVL